jgi:GntR family transcriptional regulator
MLLSIDPADGLPIYEQVVRQIVFAIAGSALLPNELVPSVRELARELAINPNTVARAYRDLQEAGVLNPVRGTGLAVAAEAAARCRQWRREMIRLRFRNVLVEARRSRLDDDDLRQILDGEWASARPDNAMAAAPGQSVPRGTS